MPTEKNSDISKPSSTDTKKRTSAKNDNAQKKGEITLPDPVAFAHALMKVYQKAEPVFDKWIERYSGDLENYNFDPMNIGDAYGEYVQSIMNDPEKFWKAQTDFWNKWFKLWRESSRSFIGEEGKTLFTPQKGDRRFKAPEWEESALFNFIKQSYLLTAEWMEDTVRDTQGLDAQSKEKVAFYTRQFADALSPSNFVFTNPEVLKETINSGGQNLIKGLENLIADLERGEGELKISTTQYDAFELGKNIATTPGKVVFQNDLMQLIQYEPTTKKVFETPLLIIPPWINKYYILDLRPDNSFIKYAVEQGHTVFIISWVNPTQKLAKKRFADYMHEGILESTAQIKEITNTQNINAVGYCLGGTLLTTTMAYLKGKNKKSPFKSTTLLTTLLDFEHAGDMKLFLDDDQLDLLDKEMAEKGMLQGKQLQKTFSLLRANDLIWSFVVNNYLLGKEPFPFDLLFWNDNSTNMPAAMHSFYLRNMYRDNLLVQKGGIKIDEIDIDISKVDTPAYFLSTKEDHIAPWNATYEGTKYFKGPVTFTLAASGHIAGVVNAPVKNKYCFWTTSKKEPYPNDSEKWLENTNQTDGSWWPHWNTWLDQYKGELIPAREIKENIENAPGAYVKMKSE